MGEIEEVNVEVDVGTVDNQVPILELLPRIAERMAQETGRVEADPNVSAEVETRFRTATRLARELTQEIRQAETMAPQLPMFRRRPPRPGGPQGPTGPVRPDRPDRPGRPGRPGRPNG